MKYIINSLELYYLADELSDDESDNLEVIANMQ